MSCTLDLLEAALDALPWLDLPSSSSVVLRVLMRWTSTTISLDSSSTVILISRSYLESQGAYKPVSHTRAYGQRRCHWKLRMNENINACGGTNEYAPVWTHTHTHTQRERERERDLSLYEHTYACTSVLVQEKNGQIFVTISCKTQSGSI